ncbi:hypothetical protein FYK55_01820 [Roseiconus nitratireducens]|uniref:Uncharacterized protein n=1 Tax=Roseiconus nitratireducens TaxID=2605748 RepID=A0A5M6DI13_9BACT|nr:hypothetical protein [Roseiconus nitratireducens]KAA5547171.1 hypothetical protein FYK55_01820 [Roseiconus nitratireducens]
MSSDHRQPDPTPPRSGQSQPEPPEPEQSQPEQTQPESVRKLLGAPTDPPPADEAASGNVEPPSANAAADERPFVAKLVQSSDPPSSSVSENPSVSGDPRAEDASDVRVGSPFRTDPSGPALAAVAAGDARRRPTYDDLGPMQYTAIGASTAGILVLLFAVLGAWWFPAGGAMVAMLGTVLSVGGLFAAARFRYASMGTLVLHLGLFFFCYVRSLG